MIILAHNYWKIITQDYVFGIYYWTCNFIHENNDTFACFSSWPWLSFSYENYVMSVDLCDKAVNMHNPKETFS